MDYTGDDSATRTIAAINLFRERICAVIGNMPDITHRRLAHLAIQNAPTSADGWKLLKATNHSDDISEFIRYHHSNDDQKTEKTKTI